MSSEDRSPKIPTCNSIACVIHTVYGTVCITRLLPVNPELFENLRLELRRGSLVLAVLATLRSERYGYTLRKALSENGLEVDENTLYPLLRRLEMQGLLASEWREENRRNKRFYRLSPDGEQMLLRLLAEWQTIHAAVNEILKEHDHAHA
jgi:PadR family transcriptional regulator, regulatory protein PadR